MKRRQFCCTRCCATPNSFRVALARTYKIPSPNMIITPSFLLSGILRPHTWLAGSASIQMSRAMLKIACDHAIPYISRQRPTCSPLCDALVSKSGIAYGSSCRFSQFRKQYPRGGHELKRVYLLPHIPEIAHGLTLRKVNYHEDHDQGYIENLGCPEVAPDPSFRK